MEVTAQTQTVAGWSFHALLRGSPLNRPRVAVQKTNRKGRTLYRSSLTVTSAGSLRSIIGSAGQRHKLNLRCLSGYAGKLAFFSPPPASLFCSSSLGRTSMDRFVCYTSEGETVQNSYRWPDNQKPRICILGGGFGGLYTALRLESLVWTDDKKPQVLLVDQSDKFVFKPLLYELLSGDPWEIAPSFTELLKSTSAHFIKDKVKLLRPSDHLDNPGKNGPGGTVLLESGVLVEYDWLVLALGAAAKLDVVPGSAEFAYPFSTLEDAIKVDDKLRMLEREQFSKDSSTISVAIVGCGYSGVELAATISERLKGRGIVQAINVETSICPTAPFGNREAALKVLSSRNTKLLLGYFVSSIIEAPPSKDSAVFIGAEQEISVDNEVKTLSKYILELKPAQRGLQSQILEADLVLWTVGSKPLVPELEPSEQPRALPLNGRGQAETDETLRVKGHPRIFAIGDSAAMRDSSGKLLPATAQVAFQQADFAGWNLWAAINDRPLLPFRFQNLGEMMTLGRNDAAVSPSFIDGFTLDGPIGHTARKLAYLWRLPTDEHRLKVGISWLTKAAVDTVASLQTTIANALSLS
ncbi:alternative NAD(P)H-ubiquinone oxidoreductase C1, chloroplastic/mitochondrial isoform X2 [Dendrobium catenatum]|uniref:alternative NAD(P)H-ubiquinone oxidoreductase C1, chloroplastic/mitochondrial isoform X2 n=1 Tax=Dendrobium catenatum TaxID=906689 RepID=UPI0009F60832|nr:alternative NAD(P)H-ubiquinone oxidoreductase C1, chloroplastic/mitochondrial isoform X2 [Dendrobium catenatum]